MKTAAATGRSDSADARRSMFSHLLKHASNYSLGTGLMIIAGLVSFPILTRLLTVEEYGLMSLVSTALTLLVGLGKLGMQHAALRFYSEVQAGKRDLPTRAFAPTLVYGMTAAGAIITLLWVVVSQMIPASWWGDARVGSLMLLTAGLVLIRVFDSTLANQLRAEERSAEFMTYNVVRRYFALAVTLFVLFQVAGNVWGFFAATLVSELVATVVMGVYMFRKAPPRLADFSSPLFRSMLAFGIPMLGYELSSIILAMGDRYIIQHLLGPEPLGIYSAAYNLCDYIKSMLFGSLVAAAQPMYMRYWEQQGKGATTEFIARFMRLYVMSVALVVGGLAAIGGELLALLASEKYMGGAAVIPYLVAGMGIEAVLFITGAGLYLEKRTKTMLAMVVACAVLNVGLNLALIPRLGLVGSAVATLVSFFVMMVVGTTLGRRTLVVRLPGLAALKFGAIAVAMYFAVVQIDLHNHLVNLVVRMAAGLVIYAALVLVFDRESRQGLAVLKNKLGR